MRRAYVYFFRTSLMRRRIYGRVIFGKSLSSWESGSEGYDWKLRALTEKRSLALDYLGDVNKRMPIHDAIRLKADINRKAIQSTTIPTFFEGKADDDETEGLEIDYSSLFSMIEGENDNDISSYLSPEDADLLKEEILGGDESKGTTFLRNWIGIRKDFADYQNYAAIPEGERNAWSAWYLRNTHPNEV